MNLYHHLYRKLQRPPNHLDIIGLVLIETSSLLLVSADHFVELVRKEALDVEVIVLESGQEYTL